MVDNTEELINLKQQIGDITERITIDDPKILQLLCLLAEFQQEYYKSVNFFISEYKALEEENLLLKQILMAGSDTE